MLWFEILGLGVGYLLLGIIATRVVYMLAKDEKDMVKGLSGFILLFWPVVLAISVLVCISRLAFKWDSNDH